MAVLMAFFLFGYVASAVIVVGGYDHLFKLLAGVVFLFGALFVFLVVHTGFMTIDELVSSRDERRERELEWLYQVTDVLNRILRHNLRNDLNVILALLDAVDEEFDDERGHVRTMKDQVWTLVELGDMAREIHVAVIHDLAHEPTSVSELVAEAVAEIRVRFPDAEIEVEDAQGQWIHAGPMLRTALENLLDNAIRHDDDDPTVLVSVRESRARPGAIDIQVADDGPGIPRENWTSSARTARRRCSTAAVSGCGWSTGSSNSTAAN
jgi:signal transduction histidine kinase